jgi:threonine dehydrogenase-like Zn-dependent dehydrogenase
MKTMAMTLTVVMMMFAVTLTAQKANDQDVFTAMTLKGTDKVELRMIKPAGETVVITVYDKTNQRVFSKRFKKENSLLLSHDISEFPAGVYTYEIRSGNEVIRSTEIVKASGCDLTYKPMETFAEIK